MDRPAATTYLTEEYRELATDAKFTSQQTTDAYNTALDMALRQLGFQETDLATADVAQADVIKYIALLNYYALKRFVRLFAVRFDVSLPGPVGAKRSQAFEQVKQLYAEAEAEVINLGFNVGAGGFELGRLTLDFNEPSLPEEFSLPAWWY
jgi:hypothetical protein